MQPVPPKVLEKALMAETRLLSQRISSLDFDSFVSLCVAMHAPSDSRCASKCTSAMDERGEMVNGGDNAETGQQLQAKGPQGVAFAPSQGVALPGGSSNLVGSQTKRIGTIQPPPDIKAIVVCTLVVIASHRSSSLRLRYTCHTAENECILRLLSWSDLYGSFFSECSIRQHNLLLAMDQNLKNGALFLL